MQFFNNLYDNPVVETAENKAEIDKDTERICKLGEEYLKYLDTIKSYLPGNFLKIYTQYTEFNGLDLSKLVFDHKIYNHPKIIMTLDGLNYEEKIVLTYLDVVSFNTNLSQKYYFEFYSTGYPGMIGANEFELIDGYLSHKILFYSPDSIEIVFKKLKIEIVDKKKSKKKWPFLKK